MFKCGQGCSRVFSFFFSGGSPRLSGFTLVFKCLSVFKKSPGVFNGYVYRCSVGCSGVLCGAWGLLPGSDVVCGGQDLCLFVCLYCLSVFLSVYYMFCVCHFVGMY